MKTIIVGTDYSNAAENALHFAASLARETGARIILFNSFQLPVRASESYLSSVSILKYIDENKARLSKIANSVGAEFGISVEAVSTISYVAEELNSLADEHKADLIVLGSQEHATEFEFLGSLTTYLISNTKYPVLVIPEGTAFNGIRNIAFACDFNCMNPENKLLFLRELVRAYKAHLHVVHVKKIKDNLGEQDDYKNIPDLDVIFDGISHTYRDLSDQHILTGIERSVREINADILVMIPRHTGFWNMIFNRSKTCQMAKKAQVPLLAMPFLERAKKPSADSLKFPDLLQN